jgi:hypothetical protein
VSLTVVAGISCKEMLRTDVTWVLKTHAQNSVNFLNSERSIASRYGVSGRSECMRSVNGHSPHPPGRTLPSCMSSSTRCRGGTLMGTTARPLSISHCAQARPL